jgi:mercuric ion binding protein
MKTLRIFSILAVLLSITQFSFAQKTTTETIPVSGNCGMCKSKIEKAAKKAGATKAEWNMEEKTLSVSYNNSSTNAAKIQQAIAAVGYDTRDFKTTEEAYNKLHGCCKYERESATKLSCCEGKCEMKDGKCTDTTVCKEAEGCKNSTCGKKS